MRWWGTSDAGTKLGTVVEDEFVGTFTVASHGIVPSGTGIVSWFRVGALHDGMVHLRPMGPAVQIVWYPLVDVQRLVLTVGMVG
jgi:hypothetical protein